MIAGDQVWLEVTAHFPEEKCVDIRPGVSEGKRERKAVSGSCRRPSGQEKQSVNLKEDQY
jgi:hypothetical protein